MNIYSSPSLKMSLIQRTLQRRKEKLHIDCSSPKLPVKPTLNHKQRQWLQKNKPPLEMIDTPYYSLTTLLEETCSICSKPIFLPEFQPCNDLGFYTAPSLAMTTCRHFFHTHCLLTVKGTCPVCVQK